MAWNYDQNELTVDLNKVRLLIQDTKKERQLLQDEEIGFFLLESPDIYRAASQCCYSLAAKFGREIDRSVIGASDSPSRTAEFYIRLAEQYEKRANATAEVFAGGRTISGKEDLAQDDNAIQPAFGVGMDDNGNDQHSNFDRFDFNSDV